MWDFWNDSEATTQRAVDDWAKSGDVGRLDENGYLEMLDRDGMAISDGFNIYPAEPEDVIAALPTVTELVVGIPDPRWGETPCAVVCVNAQSSVTGTERIELREVHLGNYGRPGKVVSRHEPLPGTLVGKVKRKEPREPFWVGRDCRVAAN